MKKFLYRNDTNQIIFYDTLEAINLNETAAFIFEKMCYKLSPKEIAASFSNEFNESLDESLDFIKDFYNEISELNLELTPAVLEKGAFCLHTPIVHIIQNCNSPCIMCDCWKTKEKTLHSRISLYPIHRKLKELGARGIMISGGEPLLHPELELILKDLKEIGLEIYLNTNGFLIKKNLSWLKKLEIEELVISMDGLNSDDYKSVRGIDRFNQVCDNIKLFKKENPNTRIIIRTTLTKHTINHLDELISFAKSNSIDHIGFSPLDVSSSSFSRSKTSEELEKNLVANLLPSEKELLESISKLREEKISQFLTEQQKAGYISWGADKIVKCLEFYINTISGKHKKYSEKPCAFPFYSVLIDYDGSIKGCFYDTPFGNIQDFKNIDWSFSKRIDRLKSSLKCKDCRGKIFCDSGDYINV